MIRNARALSAIAPVLALSLVSSAATAASAPRSAPDPLPLPHDVPDAVERPYPGVIALDVDATDIVHGVYRVDETIPVAPGTRRLTLQLPQWLPGHHAPLGTIEELLDIHFLVDGKPIAWRRDPVEVFAFHLELPAGTSQVEARFLHTPPQIPQDAYVAGRVTMTDKIIDLQWDRMSLYPAGYFVRGITVKPSARFPQGWGVATALDGRVAEGNKLSWSEVAYDTLIDSPAFSGVNFQRFELGHDVALNVVADKAEDLAIKPANLAHYKALVDEALLAFGSHHFDHYDFLLALSDHLGGIGLEHHRSSENSMKPKALTEWDEFDYGRNVVPHEFSHSWDGKFRRPASLWGPDYRTPQRSDLLWVYEGQTQFWGYVLAARSGVQSKEAVLGMFANAAGLFTQWPGREWRSLADTTPDMIMDGRRPKPYASLDRDEDYYTEGALIWLEADQIIREGTKGAKGLDDFARGFFGVRDGDYGELTYGFDDVVAALNAVYPYDWAKFLDQRVNHPGQPVPLGGIARGGYSLVWKDTPNPFDKARMSHGKLLSLFHSVGLTIDHEGRIMSARWDSPGFNAGLVPSVRIVAVNGVAFSDDAIREAITAAKGNDKPIDIIYQRGERVVTTSILYHDGLRYPWLELTAPGREPAGLDRLLAARRQ